MRKLFKFSIALTLLLITVVIVAPLIIDPNDYRAEIQQIVKEKTGRDLLINGDLSLSVFPWLGVSVNAVSLSNAKGFEAKYFAAIETANVKVKLLPLISKKIEVSTIVLNGLQLNLAKNKQGISNWDDLSQSSTSSSSKGQAAATKETSANGSAGLAALAIGGVQINDANIIWDDASTGEKTSLSDFNLSTDALSLGKAMAIELGFSLQQNKPATQTQLKLSGDLLINDEISQFDFQDMAITIDSRGESIPNGSIAINIHSHLVANTAGAGSLNLNPIKIHFDQTNIDGSASVNNFANPAINFKLAIDNINVDHYLSDEKTASNSAKAVPASPAVAALIPVETLRSLNIDGLISIQSAIISGLSAEVISLKVDANKGVLKTQQEVKSFYNGSYLGRTTIDARGKMPKITLQESASNIELEPLLADLTGKASLSGLANINAKLTTIGNTIDAFKSSLNGSTDFNFKDGAITGIDAAALMKQAQAVLKGDLSAVAEQGEGKTAFSDISGSAKITNGLLSNNDLLIATPVVNMTGRGTANLVNEKIDYQLTMQRTKALSEEEAGQTKDLNNTAIPVNIAGTFTKPSYKLDVKAIVMSSQKEKINEKKQSLKNKLEEKINEKFGDGAAGQLLKGFF